MIKILILVGILICSGYSDEEKNTENLALNEQKSQTEFRFMRDNFKNQYEKQSVAACEENNDENFEFSAESMLPVTASSDLLRSDNKFVPKTVYGSDHNYKRNSPNVETINRDSMNTESDDFNKNTNQKVDNLEFVAVKSNIDMEKMSTNKNIENLENLCNNDTNMNAKPRNDDTIGYLKSLPPTRRILPGIIENPTAEELTYNKLIQNEPQINQIDSNVDHIKNLSSTRRMLQDNIKNSINQELTENRNDNVQSEIDERQGIISSADKTANTFNTMNVNDLLTQNYMPLEDSVESKLMEPTKGKGISNMKDAHVMLLENSRVCYACSTVTDPSCWNPNRETTVKYCQKGHNSCLTKSFNYKDTSFMIRDCGSYCVNPTGDRYSSCSICHSDLCNSASTISLYNTGIVVLVVLFGMLFSKS